MDDRGRLAQPLTRTKNPPRRQDRRSPGRRRAHLSSFLPVPPSYLSQLLRPLRRLLDWRPPRGAGTTAAFLLVFFAFAFGVVRGGHLETVAGQFKEMRDAAANAAGFRIASIAFAGEKEVSREQILAGAGVSGRSSLLFLDAAAARARLKSNPWIAEATVLKLYPDHLRIDVTERQAFARWQKAGRIVVIAADGTVVQPFVDARFAGLPLLVGAGAERHAGELVALLDRHPEIRDQVGASIFVAERRWNLRLKNGVDIRLPETEPQAALATLAALARDKQLFSRDILAVDLRQADRVTVRLSDEAGQARAEALKEKKAKRKGGDA